LKLGFTGDGRLVSRGEGVHLFAHDGSAWRSDGGIPVLPPGAQLALSPDQRWVAIDELYVVVGSRGKAPEPVRPLPTIISTSIIDLDTGEEVAWRTQEETDVQASRKQGLTPEFLYLSDRRAGGSDGSGAPLELGAWGRLDLIERAVDWAGVSFEPEPTSADGLWDHSFGAGGTLLEPESKREIVRLVEGQVAEMAFSPDLGRGSEWVAVAGEDSLSLWRLGPLELLIEETCARVPRNLRPKEWPLAGPPPVTCPGL
jgi:hypothetical protein